MFWNVGEREKKKEKKEKKKREKKIAVIDCLPFNKSRNHV
jgi:hypothetical protein